MQIPELPLHTALRTAGAIAGVSSVLITGELLLLERRGLFARGGLLDWEVLATVHRWTSAGRLGRSLAWVFRPLPFRAFLFLELMLGIVVLAGSLAGALHWVGAAALLLFTCNLLVAVRSPYGRDGADEMLSFLLVGLGISCSTSDPLLQRIAIGFVCGQLLLSYVVAGVAKLVSPAWTRDGVLAGILGTDLYGRYPAVARWLRRHRGADRLLGLGVIAVEVGYPLLFLPSREFAMAILCLTLLFHLGTAVLMGLNSFFFVFSGAIVLMTWFRLSLY